MGATDDGRVAMYSPSPRRHPCVTQKRSQGRRLDNCQRPEGPKHRHSEARVTLEDKANSVPTLRHRVSTHFALTFTWTCSMFHPGVHKRALGNILRRFDRCIGSRDVYVASGLISPGFHGCRSAFC
jgi:hypothetical protein